MAQQVVNASQVAQAYTVPLEGVGQSLMYYDQLSQQRAARAQALRQQNDARNVGILDDAFKGLDVATGTPMDEVTPAHVNAAKRQLMDYMAKNPNASATDLWQQGQRATAGIANGLNQAKKVAALVDDYVKRGSTEYPQIDQTLLKNYLTNNAFRDPKTGEVLTSPNLNFYQGNELTDPELRASFANPSALAQGVQKDLADMKPVEWQDAAPDGAILKGKARPYQARNGQFLSEPVMWQNRNVPVMSPAALMGGNGDNMPTNGFVSKMDGVPADLLNTLKARPMFQDALIAERRRLKRESKDELNGASDAQVERLAAYNLLQNYGSRDGFEAAAPDYTIVDHYDKKRHQAFSESMAVKGLQMQQRRLSLAENADARAANKDARAQQAKEEKTLASVPGILSIARLDPAKYPQYATQIQHNQSLEQNNREKVTIGGIARPATNLSSMQGTQLMKPGTRDRVILRLANFGPNAGEVLMETPLTYDRITRKWVENPKSATYYSESLDPASFMTSPSGSGGGVFGISHTFSNNFSIDPSKIVKKPWSDRLQQYDAQFKGLKPDHDNQWNAVEAADDAADYTQPVEE